VTGHVFRSRHPATGRSSPEHPNATAYRRTADAFRAADTEALQQLIAEDVVWRVPGRNPLAGDVHGRDALFDWFARLRQVTDGTFALEEYDVIGNDEHVVALSRMSAVKAGGPLGVDVISVFHYRDGTQYERWFFPEDPESWDRLLS
jgi:ketosteroid isomerase-like protein